MCCAVTTSRTQKSSAAPHGADDREESDVDLIVDFGPGTDIIGIKGELEDVLGVPVDSVPRNGLEERVRSRAAKDFLPR